MSEEKKKRLAAVIGSRIEDEITSGKLRPGDRLPAERSLEIEHKTSRRTIREALKSLEEKGLIEIRRGRTGGAYIKEPTTDELADALRLYAYLKKIPKSHVTRFRSVLEAEAAYYATSFANSDQIKKMKSLLGELEAALLKGDDGFKEYQHCDRLLHKTVAQSGGNRLLAGIAPIIIDLDIESEGREGSSQSVISESVDDWAQVISAIELGQAQLASSLIRAHIRKFHTVSDLDFMDDFGNQTLTDERFLSEKADGPLGDGQLSQSNQEAMLMLAGGSSFETTPHRSLEPAVDAWRLPTFAWWTGPWHAVGKEARFALEMAISEINESGGIRGLPVEPVWLNSGYDTETTIQQLGQALARRPLILIGPHDDVAVSVACPMAAQEQVFLLSGAGDNVPFIRSYPWGTGLCGTVEGITKAAAEYWIGLHRERIKSAVLFVNMKSLAVRRQAGMWIKVLRESGVKIIPALNVEPGQENYGIMVQAALKQKAESFILFTEPTQAAGINIELRKAGVEDGWRIVNYLGAGGTVLYKTAQGYLENTYTYNICNFDHEGSRWRQLLAAFRKMKNDPKAQPVYLLPFAYDIPFIIKEAFEALKITGDLTRLNRERRMLRDYIMDLTDFEGVQGKISMVKGTGGAARSIFFYQIKDNAPQLIANLNAEMVLPD